MFGLGRALPGPNAAGLCGARRSAAVARRTSAATYRTKAAAQRGYRGSRRQDEEDDDVGWWEKPKAHADSNPLDALSPWQTRRLEEAYSVGRRKVQVSALAKELDVDRSIVTEWFKRFSKLPESEQAAIMGERRREMQWEEGRAKAKAAAAAEGQPRPKAKAEQPDVPEQGFIPFKVRKTQPRDKKLRQDVVRTLEMVYERTPFPSDDVIRSLWDLHKIPRSTAIEWFKSKRQEMNGGEEQAFAGEPAVTQQPRTAAASKGAKPARSSSGAAGAAEPGASSRPGAQAAAAAANSRAAGLATTSEAALAPAQAAAKPKKKGRFDDVKIVVSESVDPSTEEQLAAPRPPTADETMENLVMSYGELLVKAAQKDGVDAARGSEQPDSWADAWRWHRQKRGMPRWKPLNWSAWLERLSYTTDADLDEELLLLDRSQLPEGVR